MAVTFSAVDEPQPGAKWRRRWARSWPAYRGWYLAEGLEDRPSAEEGRRKIRQYLPELTSVYDDLCHLAGDDDICHRFLSLYNPPRMAVGCSQLVRSGGDGPQLLRNYDFSPNRWEGLLLRSNWRAQSVLGMVDCLWGLLDGINQSGLAVSLAFGGDPRTGNGFAVPILVRYLLETCSSVSDAKDALRQIPSFMTYSLSLVDKHSDYCTVFLAPGRKPRFLDQRHCTNHQGDVRWPKYARYTRTVERAQYLERRLGQDSLDDAAILKDFLLPPLYASSWSHGFGTLYTASYKPLSRSLYLVLAGQSIAASISEFTEEQRILEFTDH